MVKKCEHTKLIKIKHWWYNYQCASCKKKFKWIPKGDWFTIRDDK